MISSAIASTSRASAGVKNAKDPSVRACWAAAATAGKAAISSRRESIALRLPRRDQGFECRRRSKHPGRYTVPLRPLFVIAEVFQLRPSRDAGEQAPERVLQVTR